MGLVSDEDFERELESQSGSQKAPSVTVLEKESVERGRKEGDVNVPESLRKIIGEEGAINGRTHALQIAKQFGVSSSSVSAYTKGATSTASYNSPSQNLISHINKSRQRALKRASGTLNQALSAITQEKLDYSDAKDLSSIAKDMSVIIKNLEPQQEVSVNEQKVQFTIFAPQFRDEKTFESITVSE